MNYANHKKENLPIGSGVTEAACKVIINERLSQSGMKWTISGAQNTLSVRALCHTGNRWQQFWSFIDSNGFCEN